MKKPTGLYHSLVCSLTFPPQRLKNKNLNLIFSRRGLRLEPAQALRSGDLALLTGPRGSPVGGLPPPPPGIPPATPHCPGLSSEPSEALSTSPSSPFTHPIKGISEQRAALQCACLEEATSNQLLYFILWFYDFFFCFVWVCS